MSEGRRTTSRKIWKRSDVGGMLLKGHHVQIEKWECSFQISITDTEVSSNTRPPRTRAFHFRRAYKAYAPTPPHSGGWCCVMHVVKRGREGVSAEASAFGSWRASERNRFIPALWGSAAASPAFELCTRPASWPGVISISPASIFKGGGRSKEHRTHTSISKGPLSSAVRSNVSV